PVAVTSTAPVINISLSLIPAVTIAASPTPICSGSPVTFTATPINGGTTPVYQWQLNGSIVGTNSNSYTSNSLVNGDIVRVTMTSSETCASPSTVTSTAPAVTITPSVTPAVSIAVSTTTICSGTPVTFIATPINGGSTPVYKWQVNGVNVGTNSRTYTSTSLVNGDIVSVIMTSNIVCAISNQATNSFTIVIDPQKCPNGFYMPTGFTPNKDGRNDVLKPLIFGNVIYYRFSIYNRWGQKIFETNDLQKGWDGKLSGTDTDTNVFVWLCTFQFQGKAIETRKGTAVLIR
ncbi:MAG: gliding motility-associated C-terminal domain-containing protein, partial [Bacteroidota bacterium]|nr:gliding motility-associated C-terminal domain-containing protein [Bacteroidota bacterium]